MTRPTVLVAHMALLPAFGSRLRARVEAVADVPDWEPVTSFDGLDRRLAETDVILGHWGCPFVDESVLERAPRLRLLAYGAGTVKMTVTPEVCERIVVTTANAANARPVAEFTLAMILLANKATFVSAALARDHAVLERLPAMPTVGNRNKRVGIVGASTIGRLVIEALRPFDLEVVVSDPYLDDDAAAALGVRLVELGELLASSDVVSLHAPALPSTVGMIGRDQLAAMKDGATLINTARGILVDWEALTDAVVSGRLHAVLDTTDPHEPIPTDWPGLGLPNVFVTPHIAGAQGTEVARLSELAVEEVERFVRSEPPRYPVRAADWDRIG